MLGNPKWFKRRKYTGWGITPYTWQGWLYTLCWVMVILLTSTITKGYGLPLIYQLALTAVPITLMLADVISIMVKMNHDEREHLHEAIAERNVAWFITLVLSLGIVYQSITSTLQGFFYVDPFLMGALFGGVVIKAFSNWYLIDK